jgi:Api92-like protein with ferredoxin domain
MPNHIQNRLKFIGSKEQVKLILKAISGKYKDGDKMQIDFNKIIPMPSGIESNPHSGIQIWIEICTGLVDFRESNFQNAMNDILSGLKLSTAIRVLKSDKNILSFSNDEFDHFIQGLKNMRLHGNLSWYDWSIKHWGTKWNAYQQNDKRNTSNTIYFQTAWSSPIELIKTLSSQFPEIELELTYADEDTSSNSGRIKYKGGQITESFQPESQSIDGYEIYFELNPECKKRYKLANNTYEYIDDEN